MQTYSYKQTPIKVCGVVDFEKKGEMRRIPEELIEKIPRLSTLGKRCPGARLCFRTDSQHINIKLTFDTLRVDKGMSMYSCQSMMVYCGDRQSSRFVKLISPKDYDTKIVEGTAIKEKVLEDVVIWLPRNEPINDIEISIDDDSQLLPPTPYKYPKPILYYGSSITEGGCADNVTCAYNAIISRHLDVDYYNFGFSGNARGDLNMAEYISDVDMSVFVYDYDYNAPDVDHLERTHEPFFKVIREKNPDLPIVLMTRPAAVYSDEEKLRRAVVRKTYENALKAGDRNVYFIDGEQFFGETDREICTVDTIHPNSLGFHRMASVIEPVIKEILEGASSCAESVPSGEKSILPTYCNPLCIEDTPAGRWLDMSQTKRDEQSVPDYRSIADPSVVYHEGKWIMYASYGLAHVSEDFVHWKHVDIGIPHLRYSPAVVCFRGKWYIQGHGRSEVYTSDDPLGPFSLCGYMTKANGEVFSPADGCFLADGDKLYFYWFASRRGHDGENADMFTGTQGAEMDPERPWQCITEPVWINQFDPSVKWQRVGEYNQNSRRGWIEGQWAFKIGKRYYLLHSGCGTEFSAYANGIVYSDEGPLSGFVPQKNQGLLCEKRSGLLRGAGHGSIVEGPNGTYWLFYTNVVRYQHMYERRISMDPVGIDKYGELYCPATTEVPQYAPGIAEHPEKENDAGLLPLTFYQPVTASSFAEGRDPLYAVDESTLTWWQPSGDDAEPTLTVNIGGIYDIYSVRLMWRDVGMDTLNGIYPGAFQYVLESHSPSDNAWHIVLDASDNKTDLCVDYRTVDAASADKVRIRIVGAPEGINPGLINFTAFGRMPSRSLG